MELREGAARPALRRSVASRPIPAIRLSSAAPSATLRPMPITTQAGPPDSARSSISTPPSLRPSASRSFGHLSAARSTPWLRRAFSAHTPTTRLSAPMSAGTSRNVQLSERQIAPPGGASQARPRRPLPALWCSASSTSLVPTGGLARARRTVLVEEVDQTVSMALTRSRSSRGRRSRIFAASSGSVVSGMR